MGLVDGLTYNIKGFLLGIKTPKLLFWGIFRFVAVLILAILLSGTILYFHEQTLSLIWKSPESGVLAILWHIVSWLLSAVLASVSAILAYFIAQLLFCVFIMDYMSRITERIVTGREIYPENTAWTSFFLYLVRQEIPRALIPTLLSLLIMAAGFLTPFGPVIGLLSALVAAVFLAWDNTDLVPARRMDPFKDRFGYLKKNIFFHIGFGLLFIVPWVNILFLSFAPVGATLYYIDRNG